MSLRLSLILLYLQAFHVRELLEPHFQNRDGLAFERRNFFIKFIFASSLFFDFFIVEMIWSI